MSDSLDSLAIAIVDCEHKTAPIGDGFAFSVGTKAMKDGRIVLEACKPVDEGTYERWTRRMRPEPGDLILAREAPVGQVVRVPDDIRTCLGQRTVLIRPDGTKVHPRFLHFWLLGPHAQQSMASQAAGATVPHLNVADIRNLNTSAMPMDRQIQEFAAETLGALDDLIENNRRRIELLEHMAQAIYQEWFVRFRYPGHEDVQLVESQFGDIPKGWEFSTIGEVMEFKYGKALKADARRGGDVAVVGSSGVVGWHDAHLLAGPSVIVGRKGNVGNVVWLSGRNWPIDTTFYVDTPLPLRYVCDQLRRAEFRDSHAAVPGLSREQAYSLPFLLPEPRVMNAYAELADILGATVESLRSQSTVLAGARDLLLPKLVTGEIDVSDIDLGALVESVA